MYNNNQTFPLIFYFHVKSLSNEQSLLFAEKLIHFNTLYAEVSIVITQEVWGSSPTRSH